MRSTMTAVLERNAAIRDGFSTEPYEMPWAAEARFFVQVLDGAPEGAALTFHTQVSPDGLHWCDADDQPHRMHSSGMTTWPVEHFGQWLRLRTSAEGGDAVVRARIYLVGKG